MFCFVLFIPKKEISGFWGVNNFLDKFGFCDNETFVELHSTTVL